jgi:hypothetical protein
MKRLISVVLLTATLAGCAHDSPCVPTYDDQGRLVHTNTCVKGTTQDNWEPQVRLREGLRLWQA